MTTLQKNFADMLGKDIFVNEICTQFAELKRDLSPTQERQLLSWHAKRDFEYPTTNLRETMRVLLDKGYLKEDGKHLDVTAKGEQYLDEHSFDIRSAPRRIRERTPFQKAILEEALIDDYELGKKYYSKHEEPKKKIIEEKEGQMTLFGKLGFTKRDAAEARTHEYAAFMRKLQDTALDLLEQNKSNRIKLDRFQGDVKISEFHDAPTYNQARQMIYPNLEYIFFDVIARSNDRNRLKIYNQLEKEQGEIIKRQEQIEIHRVLTKSRGAILPLPKDAEKKAEKKIAEKGGQMTLFGRLGALSSFKQREYERIYNDLYLKSEKAAEALGKKGYDWYQINHYVESLAVSLTPDSFGKIQKLNRGQSKYLQDLEQAYKPKTIPESKGQMTLFGIKDLSPEELEKFKQSMSQYESLNQFLDAYMAYSSGIKVRKAIESLTSQIEYAKENAPLDPEDRKDYTRIITHLSKLVDAIPPELDDLTFNAVWNLAKSKEQPKQLTLFGRLEPYYFKDTGAKIFVSDKIKYHHGPAFKREDRYRLEILDENKEHMGTMSPRQIEAQLTKTRPAIQSSLFGVRFKADVTANQIRSRIFDPNKIIEGTYFTRESTTPGVSYVMGQNEKNGKFVTQSIRFDRSIFDTRRAKRWFKANLKRIQDRDAKTYPYPKPYYMKLEGIGARKESWKHTDYDNRIPSWRKDRKSETERDKEYMIRFRKSLENFYQEHPDISYDKEPKQLTLLGYNPKMPKSIPKAYRDAAKPYRTGHGTAIFWMDPTPRINSEGKKYWLFWNSQGTEFENYDIKDLIPIIKKPAKTRAEQLTLFGRALADKLAMQA